MKLIPNAKSKMRAYSICTLILIALVFYGPEQYFAITGDVIDPYLVGNVMLFLIVFGIIGWFIDQTLPSILRTLKLAGISVIITAVLLWLVSAPAFAIGDVPVSKPVTVSQPKSGLPTWEKTAIYAIPLTKQWEGTGPTFKCSESARGICVRAYLDRIPEPDLPTICYGETSHTGTRVAMGDVRTIEQCEAGLYRIMREQYWSKYRTGVTIDYMPPQVDAVFTDLAWNVGPFAVLKSSALKSANRGDFADACYRHTFYNKSGGVLIRGLKLRRSAGYEVCMSGVGA
ncbi:glycoside hydrolase family protein [Sulfitobacter sp. M22]|uniref:glycoside hydrolase family protein n=1 Tax=Sulfitobacter sp. M22 TaxID=2675332 RepID=UPI001EFFDAE2|nr:glycoside hydrolase family protein [Sulfitobacter sp. M22]MCF7725793.1 glycoside hydrolase family protein [Sulfitobacter sp. M22]